MRNIKSIARFCGFILLMVLASIGIGLTGAAPVLPKNREIISETKPKTELIELREDKSGAAYLNELKT
jgi:hypothetical protein